MDSAKTAAIRAQQACETLYMESTEQAPAKS